MMPDGTVSGARDASVQAREHKRSGATYEDVARLMLDFRTTRLCSPGEVPGCVLEGNCEGGGAFGC